jgi:D-alanine transaminase
MIDNIVYLGGKFIEKDQAFISPFDRGFQYGDSVYEVIPVVDASLRSFDAAWARLTSSSSALAIPIGFSKTSLADVIAELIRLNSLRSGYVYLQISRGESRVRHRIENYNSNTVFMYSDSHNLIDMIENQSPLSVITVEESRWLGRDIKCTNLLPNVLAKERAYKRGADEAIFLQCGYVNEGASTSVSFIKNDTLYSRVTDGNVLNGIRSNLINEIAEDIFFNIVFGVFTIDELFSADEVFLTSATLGIAPVGKIDNVVINRGDVGPHTRVFREELIKRLTR